MKNLFLALFLAIGLTSCNGIQNQKNSQGEKTVKIGVIAPLSGPVSIYGEDAVNAYKESFDEYKKNHPDKKIKLIIEDGKCSGKGGMNAAKKLVDIDKVDIILGGLCGSEVLTGGKYAQSKGILTLSPIASAPSISKIGDYMFRFKNDTDTAKILSDEFNKKYKKIILIQENTDFIKGISTQFKKFYNGNIILDEKIRNGEKDFNILSLKIDKIKDNADAILFLSQTDSSGIGFVKALNSNGLLKKFKGKIYGAYLFNLKTFLDGVGNLSEGLIDVQMDTDSSISLEKPANYLKHFKEKYGVKSLDLMPLLAKEGIDVIFSAINAGNYNSTSIRNYLKNIDINNPRNGYFGIYYFDKNGDAIGLKQKLVVIKNGKSIDYK